MIAPQEFINRVGAKITGIVHVGSHDGEEIPFYLKLGITNIICFEASPGPVSDFLKRFYLRPDCAEVLLIPVGLGDYNGLMPLRITSGSRQQSTFLGICNETIALGDAKVEYTLYVQVYRFANLVERLPFLLERVQQCNCLVVDVQGMELDVLKGMDGYLQQFAYVAVECSSIPVYEGAPLAPEIIAWMEERSYQALNIYEHDRHAYGEHSDVLFVKK